MPSSNSSESLITPQTPPDDIESRGEPEPEAEEDGMPVMPIQMPRFDSDRAVARFMATQGLGLTLIALTVSIFGGLPGVSALLLGLPFALGLGACLLLCVISALVTGIVRYKSMKLSLRAQHCGKGCCDRA
jgi:hypothetical protein